MCIRDRPKWPALGLSADDIARALISMMARITTRSNQRPDTLMQDRSPPARQNPLATHGRTIHWVISGQTVTSPKPEFVRFGLPAQPVDATQALNLSAGVSNCKVLRGRSFS